MNSLPPTLLIIADFVPNQWRSIEQFLLKLARSLDASGVRTDFVFAGAPSTAIGEQLEQLKSSYTVARFPLRDIDALVAETVGRQPTVMMTLFVSPFSRSVWKLWRALNRPAWIVYDHSSGVASRKGALKKMVARLRGWYVGRCLSRILAVSDFVAHRAIEQAFLPAHKTRVIYNGIDTERFSPSEGREANIPIKIVYAGQLLPSKGVITLLKAAHELKNDPDSPPFAISIAGKGASRQELQRFCDDSSMDNVQFLGQVSAIESFFADADVAVVPSEWDEAFGLVAAEAMACGTCVIVSDAGGLPEVVGERQEAGLIFRRGDAKELAEKLTMVLRDEGLRNRLRRAARARVEECFSIDRMVDEVSANVLEFTPQRSVSH